MPAIVFSSSSVSSDLLSSESKVPFGCLHSGHARILRGDVLCLASTAVYGVCTAVLDREVRFGC